MNKQALALILACIRAVVSGNSDTWSPISSDVTSNSVMEKGIHSKVKAAVAQWKKKNPVGGCLTLTTRSPCQFPFTFNKRMYSSCTTAGHPIGRPWCFTQEEEGEWDFCDVGCPVEVGCPNGWNKLQSGCYQDLNVSGGVDYEAADAVCAQYGARLVSSSSLEERQDLLEFYRNKRR